MDLMQVIGQCDNGYACVYQNNLSWSSPTTPLPAEGPSAARVREALRRGRQAEDRKAELRKRASLLDFVKDDLGRLERSLGPADRSKVSHYLDAVREVERRIQKAEADAGEHPMPDLERPVGVPASYGDHARLMFDLQVLAFQGDVTRVIAFQLARETSNRTYPEVGVPDPHHPAVAPRERSGEDRTHVARQPVPRVALRRVPAQAGRDARRRRLAPRPLGDPLRQRHGQSERPRPHQPADPGGRHRRGRPEGRMAFPLREADAARERPPDAARQVGVRIDKFGDSTGRWKAFPMIVALRRLLLQTSPQAPLRKQTLDAARRRITSRTRGADANARRGRQTALHWAAQHDNEDPRARL
jgi:hypothetical protein